MYGWEPGTAAPPPDRYCTLSRSRHQNQMAALVSGFFGIIFVQWKEVATRRPSFMRSTLLMCEGLAVDFDD